MEECWLRKAEYYLKSQGMRQINEEAYCSLVPEDIRNCFLGMVEDSNAPFGERPPDKKTVKWYFNMLAPYYDYQIMTVLDTEAKVDACLAETIRRQGLKNILDSGCGTGLTATFLAKEFPEANFSAYDIAGNMIRRARVRRKKLKLANLKIFTLEHSEMPEAWQSNFDLLFAKCSFAPDHVIIPDFSFAPSPSLAQEDYGSPFLFSPRLTGY